MDVDYKVAGVGALLEPHSSYYGSQREPSASSELIPASWQKSAIRNLTGIHIAYNTMVAYSTTTLVAWRDAIH